MCYNMTRLLTTFFILTQTLSFGQTNKFKWTTELCEYEGTYDTNKYSDTQLKNTYKLWFSEYFRISTPYSVWYPQHIEKLNVDSLDNEYQKKSDELRHLDIVKTPFWEAYRQRKLKDLDEVYKLGRITLLGYKNPDTLRQYAIADTCIKKYVDALISGGDKLLETWRQIHEQQLINNGSPEKLNAKFNEQFNSTDKYKYAQVDVMNFGWWNCAIKFMDYSVVTDPKGWENFDKLFKKIKTIECDEP